MVDPVDRSGWRTNNTRCRMRPARSALGVQAMYRDGTHSYGPDVMKVGNDLLITHLVYQVSICSNK